MITETDVLTKEQIEQGLQALSGIGVTAFQLYAAMLALDAVEDAENLRRTDPVNHSEEYTWEKHLEVLGEQVSEDMGIDLLETAYLMGDVLKLPGRAV